MSLKGRLVWVLVVWGMVCLGWGETLITEDTILEGRHRTMLNRAVEHLGHPGVLTSEDEVKVLVNASGGFWTVALLGEAGTEALQWAEILEEWAGRDSRVVYGEEKLGPVALVTRKSGGLWQSEATSSVDLGRLEEILQREGVTGHLALFLSRDSSGVGDWSVVDEGRRWSLVQVEGEWPSVTRTTTLEWWDVPASAVVLVLPFVALLVIGGALFLYARREDIPLEKRQKTYKQWIGTGTMVPLFMGMPLMFVVFRGGGLVRILDVWWGTGSVQGAIFALPVVFMASILPFLVMTVRIEKQYLVERDEEGKVVVEEEPEIIVLAERTHLEARRRKLWVFVEVARFPLGFGILFLGQQLFPASSGRHYSALTGLAIMFLPNLIRWLSSFGQKEYAGAGLAAKMDDALVARVARIAQLVQIRVEEVAVVRGQKSDAAVAGVYLFERLSLGSDLVESESGEVQDAAIALTLCSAKVEFGKWIPIVVYVVPVVLAGTFFALTSLVPGFPLRLIDVAFVIPVLAFPYIIYTFIRRNMGIKMSRFGNWKEVIETLRRVDGALRYAEILDRPGSATGLIVEKTWSDRELVVRAAKELGYDYREAEG